MITEDPPDGGWCLRLLEADERKRLMSMRYADTSDFSTLSLPHSPQFNYRLYSSYFFSYPATRGSRDFFLAFTYLLWKQFAPLKYVAL